MQIEAIFMENNLYEGIKNSVFNLKDYLSYFTCFGQICCVHFELKAAKGFASLALKLISLDNMLDDAYGASAYFLMGEVLLELEKFEEGKRHFEPALLLFSFNCSGLNIPMS